MSELTLEKLQEARRLIEGMQPDSIERVLSRYIRSQGFNPARDYLILPVSMRAELGPNPHRAVRYSELAKGAAYFLNGSILGEIP